MLFLLLVSLSMVAMVWTRRLKVKARPSISENPTEPTISNCGILKKLLSLGVYLYDEENHECNVPSNYNLNAQLPTSGQGHPHVSYNNVHIVVEVVMVIAWSTLVNQ